MGKNLDKLCEECDGAPLIQGRRWTKHCIDKHDSRIDVQFGYAPKLVDTISTQLHTTS
jgi:hypothetical protein